MTAKAELSVLVYDVGGSHVAAAVCHPDTYRLGPVVTAPHPNEQTSNAFVGLLHSLGMRASAGLEPVAGAELAFPGPFDFAAGVSHMKHKLPYLFSVDLRQEIAGRFDWEPGQVRFLHDSAAFLLGEIGGGAARGVERAVGITLGTGIGSAFAIDGHLKTEGVGIPYGGEIWNLPFEDGIVEDLISTRSIQQGYKEYTGHEREVAEIAAGATQDPAAAEVFQEFGRDLGRVLRILLHDFAPEVVVIGGGISHAADLFLAAAHCELQGVALQLRISILGDRAPLVGGGVSWFSRAINSPEQLAPGIATK